MKISHYAQIAYIWTRPSGHLRTNGKKLLRLADDG